MATITQTVITETQPTTSNQYSLTRPLEELCTLQPKDIIPKLAHVTQKYIKDGCPKPQPGGLRTDRTKAFYLVLLGLHSRLDQWEMVHALQVHPMRLESMLEFAMTWYAYHFEWIPSTLQYRLAEERRAWRMSAEYESVDPFGLENEEGVSKPKGRKKSVVCAENVKNSRPDRATRTRAKETSQLAVPVVDGTKQGVRTSGRVRRAPARFLE
ncbi:hypothetical protein LTR17_017967 [Elasticomyces elasticus]|nr:hypothetical protein LTR17_017967 [Elasticomyces elasticus]